MLLRQIFDPYLAQYAYLIGCQRTGEALVIDPERDVERVRRLAEENGLRVTAVAETHIHADFVSGAAEFAASPGVVLYLSGEGGEDWSYRWVEGREGVRLLRDGDVFRIGGIEVRAVHTPGHTPEHLSFLVTDRGGGADQPMAFVSGDFLFVGDVGRPDLLESAAGQRGVMEPSARRLCESIQMKTPGLADYVQVLPGHGAGSACGKALGAVPVSTLGYERLFNPAFRRALGEPGQFVKDILTGQPEPPLYFARMKRVNRDGIRVTGGVPEIRELSFEEAGGLLADGGDVTILDGREDRGVFAAGHVKGSIHAPLRSPFFSVAAGSYVPEENRILVVVESEEDARLAATQLYRIGFDRYAGWISTEKWVSGGGSLDESGRIFFEEFDAERAAGEGLILDVRSSVEFAGGHLPGAVSIPYTRLRARLAELPAGKKLFVHCGTGKRADLAASFLRAAGYDAVHVDGVCAECERIASAHAIAH